MGTERNDASAAPIPAPPVTPAVTGSPTPAGAGVAFAPVSAVGKKRVKADWDSGRRPRGVGDCW